MVDLEERQGKQASVMSNGVVLAFQTLSGRGLLHNDPSTFSKLLPLKADLALIGATARNALEASRFLPVADAQQFFARAKDDCSAFESELLKFANVRSKKELFKNMLLCHIKLLGGQISFCPTKHVNLQGWEDIGTNLSAPVDALDQDIGTLVKQALAQCTG